MIKEFINRLNEISRNDIDAAQFNDDVASKTDWQSLSTYSSNFSTLRLTTVNRNLLKYKTTIHMKLFSGIFMAAGIGLLSFVGPRQHGRWLPNSFTEEGLAQLASLFFFVAGAATLYFVSSPIIFDSKKEMFIKGRGKNKISISFSEIYALQLIPSYVSNSDGPGYYNYQLNIVFNDGERTHIVNYSNVARASEDSKTISKFIGKKLWDALRYE